MVRVFTSRRRAKDAIIAYTDFYGYNIDVKVSEGMIYIRIPDGNRDVLDAIFHFSTIVIMDINTLKTSETYRGESVRKFKA